MSNRPSRKQQRQQLIARLRSQGTRWGEVAEVLRARYDVNARVAMRLAHGWTQRQAAAEWNKRWPDDAKAAKNFSYWETWPVTGHAPSLAVLDNLCQLYECRVADLLVDVSDYRHLDAASRTAAEVGRCQGPDRGPADDVP